MIDEPMAYKDFVKVKDHRMEVRPGLWFGVCNGCRRWRPLSYNYRFLQDEAANRERLSKFWCVPCHDSINADEELDEVARQLGIDLSFNPFAPPVWIYGRTAEDHEVVADLLETVEPLMQMGESFDSALEIMGYTGGEAEE